jgi:CorA-like Mg2+ transporter protein
VRTRCESCPRLLRHGEDYVLYAIVDFVVDNYVPVIEALESEVAELEDRVLKERISRGDVERIYQLRRELLQLRRTAAPTIEVCRRLEHLELPFIEDAIRAYFRDVVDHVQRVNESIDALREVLAFSFEAALLLQSARQGDIQRRFAGWAAILAVPTAIAGIYGMNFDFMPELAVRFGYFGVLTVILAICLYLFYRFRRGAGCSHPAYRCSSEPDTKAQDTSRGGGQLEPGYQFTRCSPQYLSKLDPFRRHASGIASTVSARGRCRSRKRRHVRCKTAFYPGPGKTGSNLACRP